MRKNVRKVVVEDYKEVYDLLIKSSDETDYLACDSRERIASGFTKDGIKSWIENLKSEKVELLVYEEDSKILGMLGLHGNKRKRFSHRVSLGMNVYKEYWGRGIGRNLLVEAIEEFKRNSNLTKLELDVRVDNERAIKLYKSSGFIEEAEYKNFFKVDGTYYNAYHMVIIK